jgi:hypothetical protein
MGNQALAIWFVRWSGKTGDWPYDSFLAGKKRDVKRGRLKFLPGWNETRTNVICPLVRQSRWFLSRWKETARSWDLVGLKLHFDLVAPGRGDTCNWRWPGLLLVEVKPATQRFLVCPWVGQNNKRMFKSAPCWDRTRCYWTNLGFAF